MVPTGTVTAALRVPFVRRRNGWAKGSQSLKSPTTDTAPTGWSAGRAKVTRTVPLRPGLFVLINCSLRSAMATLIGRLFLIVRTATVIAREVTWRVGAGTRQSARLPNQAQTQRERRTALAAM